MICHLLHGIRVRDGGKSTVCKLKPSLFDKGIFVISHNYGYLHVLDVLRKNKIIAKRIKKHFHSDDIVIAHSNGGAVAVKAVQYGATIDKLILINPALDKHFEFPEGINEIHVFHNKKDKVVVLAKWLRKLVFWRNTFLWGEMGNTGYKGNDGRVTNHRLGKHHSDIFKSGGIEKLSKEVLGIINGKYRFLANDDGGCFFLMPCMCAADFYVEAIHGCCGGLLFYPVFS